MNQENSMNTSGDGPSVKPESPLKCVNNSVGTLREAAFVPQLNSGGALQQLSDFLNLHGKRAALKDFKGNTPTIPINDLRGDEAARYPREERLLRCQLSALCRLIDLNGWTQSIYNHISAKCSPGEFLINPFGLLYHEVQASTLVKVNEHGRILDAGSTVLGVNKAGWGLHSAVHSTREDINCVVHIHLPDVVAVSCIKQGLLPVSPEAAELLPAVRFHDYVGVVADEAVADSIRSCLGAGKVLFLRNKGVTIAAATIPEAWYLMKRVITACQTQMRILQLGGGASLLNELGASVSVKGEVVDGGAAKGVVGDLNDAAAAPFSGEEAEALEGGDEQHCNGAAVAKSTSSGVTDVSSWGVGEMDFEAQMRMLDSAGYRTGFAYRNPNLLRRQPAEMPWSSSSTAGATSVFNTTQRGGDLSATGFLSDTTADVDDITAATTAGASQMARIAGNVRSNKEIGNQRNQFLSMTGADGAVPCLIPPDSSSTPLHRQSPQQHPQSERHPATVDLNDSVESAQSPTLQEASPNSPLSSSSYSSKLRKSWRSKKTNGEEKKKTKTQKNGNKSHNGVPAIGIDEPRTPPTPRSDLASRSASLPAHAKNLVAMSPRSTNTMLPGDGPAFGDEQLNRKEDKKSKNKWGTFRFPTFKKKSKAPAEEQPQQQQQPPPSIDFASSQPPTAV